MPEPLDLSTESVRTPDFLPAPRFQFDGQNPTGLEFADQDWATEFDRRLAFWQAESSDPSATEDPSPQRPS